MSDNTPKKKKPMLPGQAPKPGMQLWLLAGLVVFLCMWLLFNQSGRTVEISQQKFEQMYTAGDVRDVELLTDRNTVEVSLKPAAVRSGRYNQLLSRRGPLTFESSPQFGFRVVDGKTFKEDFEKLQANVPLDKRVDLTFDTRTSYGDIVTTWGFTILLFVGFWFLMRRMSGGAGSTLR